MSRRILYSLCLSLLFISCYEDDDEVAMKIVVEGWIESGGTPMVMLTNSIPVTTYEKTGENAEFVLPWGKVTVSDGTQTVILTGDYDERYFPSYVYTTSKMRGVPGRTYHLTVEYGDYVVTARQAKDSGQWFVGGVTDENAREMTICFDFLEPGRKYVATVYSDAPDADGVNNTAETGSESCARYKIEQKKVTSKTKMKIRMAPSGGFAISIK